MHKIVCILFISTFLFIAQAVQSEEVISKTENSSNKDLRQLVSMPDEARELMRKDMLDHLSALNEIIGNLASNDLAAASDVAETRLGRSSMGEHRGTGMGPGKFMTSEMRNLGWSMHDAASEFSKVAKEDDLKSAYGALQKITSSCVACHYNYRTQ